VRPQVPVAAQMRLHPVGRHAIGRDRGRGAGLARGAAGYTSAAPRRRTADVV